MLSPVQLGQAFERNVAIVASQTAGLTHADSLLQLPFRGNCLNWIIGHMLRSRDGILEALGAAPVFAEGARYDREADPITTDAADVLPLETLLTKLTESQAALTAALNAASEEDLAEVCHLGGRLRRVGEWAFFLYFHETYHTGQTELLRQLAGKSDKII